MRDKDSDKPTINVLMNIEDYFGEHKGRLMPWIIFLVVSLAPMFIWAMGLFVIIPLKYVLIFEVPFAIRVALRTIGNEKERYQAWLLAREDEYIAADDLVRVTHVHPDGLIEYMDGVVMYLVSGFTTTYMDDDALAKDLQQFLEKLGAFEYDTYCHMVVNEDRLQNNIESMSVYEDPELMQERIEFYMLQDEYCEKYSELYRITFAVKAPKYNWKNLKTTLEDLVRSSDAKMFKHLRICGKALADDILSRDICAYLELSEMLKKKYRNEDFLNSKVLYYGDEIPEEYQLEKIHVNLEGRRVTVRGGNTE